ncbi:unnamed protein product, partial [marine sediment metagenome]
DLEYYFSRNPDPIIQEYIDGSEYTVNILSDKKGQVIASLPIRRLRVRNGLAVVAQAEKNKAMSTVANRVVEALEIIGPSNVQIIERNNQLFVIEVNPRFASGGMPLATSAGFNIPLIMIDLMQGNTIGAINIEYGKKMIRYWDAYMLPPQNG